jgi:hypothetical protein
MKPHLVFIIILFLLIAPVVDWPFKALNGVVYAMEAPTGSGSLQVLCDNITYWYKSPVPFSETKLQLACALNATNGSCTSSVWLNDKSQLLSSWPKREISYGQDITSFKVENGIVNIYFIDKTMVPDMTYLLEVDCSSVGNFGSWQQNITYEIETSSGPSLANFWVWMGKNAVWIGLGLLTLMILITIGIKVMHGL